jgi:RNA polymerase sigma-70 factor (ECF subfamily)
MDSSNFEVRLLDRAKKGDHQAVGRLYDGLFPGVYGFACMRLPTSQDAEDIVSETFLTMVKKLPEFEPAHSGAFRAWVFRIARNKISDFYRANGNRRVIDNDGTALTATDSGVDVQAEVQRGELRLSLLASIGELQPRQQEVILLRYFGGLRNKDIAEVLAIEERTVSAHVSRALKSLQDAFKNEWIQEAS